MRNVVLAFATASLVAAGWGCGDNGGNIKLDGGMHDLAGGGGGGGDGGGGTDLATGGSTAKACGAIFDCVFQMQKSASTCAMGKPAGAVSAYNAIFECIQNKCGNDQSDSGATMPCNGSPDLGTQCNNCFQNTLIGGIITWQDAQGNTLACVPTNAPECGSCTTQQDDCISQCFTDADCAGLICNTTMMPPTCSGASGTTAGACGC